MAKKKTALEIIEAEADKAVSRLNNANLEELPAHAAAEQVRATYFLIETLEHINETLNLLCAARNGKTMPKLTRNGLEGESGDSSD